MKGLSTLRWPRGRSSETRAGISPTSQLSRGFRDPSTTNVLRRRPHAADSRDGAAWKVLELGASLTPSSRPGPRPRPPSRENCRSLFPSGHGSECSWPPEATNGDRDKVLLAWPSSRHLLRDAPGGTHPGIRATGAQPSVTPEGHGQNVAAWSGAERAQQLGQRLYPILFIPIRARERETRPLILLSSLLLLGTGPGHVHTTRGHSRSFSGSRF